MVCLVYQNVSGNLFCCLIVMETRIYCTAVFVQEYFIFKIIENNPLNVNRKWWNLLKYNEVLHLIFNEAAYDISYAIDENNT